MGDWRLPLSLTLICGRSDYGKSTFGFTYLLNAPAACRFVFDDQGRDARRMEEWGLGIRPCFTGTDLEAAVASRWVVFNPSRMFPDDFECKRGFAFFCDWVYQVSCRGPGKKFLLVNEMWRFQDRENIPGELAKIVLAGREENIELVCCTSVPHQVNSAITGQSTELVCFGLGESVQGERLDPALAKVQQLGISADAVRALPKGSFIARNRQSGSMLSGKVF
jgi:hypothetical protein